jgi:hypothetical protein
MPWPKATLGTAALTGALTGVGMAVATLSSIKAPELGLLMMPVFFLSFAAFVAGTEGRIRPRELWGLDPDARAKLLAPSRKRVLVFIAWVAVIIVLARLLWPI